jgi:hypothetical protein
MIAPADYFPICATESQIAILFAALCLLKQVHEPQ